MKKLLVLIAFLMFGFACVPQSAQAYEPWGAGIYTGTVSPLDYSVPGATVGRKVGEASCKTLFALVSWGDCSIKAAMENGRITKVTAADWKKNFILIYGEKTLRVYGN